MTLLAGRISHRNQYDFDKSLSKSESGFKILTLTIALLNLVSTRALKPSTY